MSHTYFPLPETSGGVRFIFTGAPGSGKTTTANYLAKNSNCKVVDEAATRYIQELQEKNLNPRENPLEFTHNIKELQIKDMEKNQNEGISIFDRSLICSLTYDDHYGVVDDKYEAGKESMNVSFHPTVFLFELNSDSYIQNSVRSESFDEAKVLDDKFFEAYQKAGYNVKRVPWMPIHERATAVFQEMKNALVPLTLKRPITQLCHFGEGMNDEGGRIQECVTKGQIWANLSVVLDRPLIDPEDFDTLRKIKKEKGYGIKEEALNHFNEKQVNLAYAAIIQYYVTQCRKILSKSSSEPVTIFIHTFRGGDGPSHLKLFKELFQIACGEIADKEKIDVLFSSGKADKNPNNCVYTSLKNSGVFKNADIVLTFSSHAGLKPEWETGSLTIPHQWTPIDAKTMEIQKHQKYKGENHLLTAIDDIIKVVDQKTLAKLINDLVVKNPEKKDLLAKPLQKEDFYPAKFLELGGHIFIPSQVNDHFTILT